MILMEVQRNLDAKKDIAERALANYTEFKNALETGQPIFNYTFGKEPIKNNYLIAPVPMFHNALNSSEELRQSIRSIPENLLNLVKQLSHLKTEALTAWSTRRVDTTLLHDECVRLSELCRQF
ncbi:hypothetical protein EGW08_016261, partial [Elysia chlorotica]